MEIKAIKQYKDILITVLCVLILDILLKSYFIQNLGYSGYGFVVFDIIVILLAVTIGRLVIKELGFPMWRAKYSHDVDLKHIIASILLGVLIIISNTVIWSRSNGDMVSWISFSSYHQPIFLSLRAAVTEEIIFRLFIFSTVTLMASKISKSKMGPLVVGALVSSILFGLFHQGFYLPFIYAVMLCYVYRYNGLLLAMLIHFLSDAFPFILIYLDVLR